MLESAIAHFLAPYERAWYETWAGYQGHPLIHMAKLSICWECARTLQSITQQAGDGSGVVLDEWTFDGTALKKV